MPLGTYQALLSRCFSRVLLSLGSVIDVENLPYRCNWFHWFLFAQGFLAGHDVVAIRRSGSLPVIPLDQQPSLCERSLFQLNPNDLLGTEVVIHLASAGVSPKQVSWRELFDINVAASLHLIKCLIRQVLDVF